MELPKWIPVTILNCFSPVQRSGWDLLLRSKKPRQSYFNIAFLFVLAIYGFLCFSEANIEHQTIFAKSGKSVTIADSGDNHDNPWSNRFEEFSRQQSQKPNTTFRRPAHPAPFSDLGVGVFSFALPANKYRCDTCGSHEIRIVLKNTVPARAGPSNTICQS